MSRRKEIKTIEATDVKIINPIKISIFEVIIKNMLPRLGTRLYGSLKIDDSHIKSILSWKAPFNSHEGLKMTVLMMKSNDEPRI